MSCVGCFGPLAAGTASCENGHGVHIECIQDECPACTRDSSLSSFLARRWGPKFHQDNSIICPLCQTAILMGEEDYSTLMCADDDYGGIPAHTSCYDQHRSPEAIDRCLPCPPRVESANNVGVPNWHHSLFGSGVIPGPPISQFSDAFELYGCVECGGGRNLFECITCDAKMEDEAAESKDRHVSVLRRLFEAGRVLFRRARTSSSANALLNRHGAMEVT